VNSSIVRVIYFIIIDPIWNHLITVKMGGKPVPDTSIDTFLKPCSTNGSPESVVWKISAFGNVCRSQVLALICESILAEAARV
jgi:hypothetical protein